MNQFVKALVKEQLESRLRGMEFLMRWETSSKSWASNLKRGIARVQRQLQELDRESASVVE